MLHPVVRGGARLPRSTELNQSAGPGVGPVPGGGCIRLDGEGESPLKGAAPLALALPLARLAPRTARSTPAAWRGPGCGRGHERRRHCPAASDSRDLSGCFRSMTSDPGPTERLHTVGTTTSPARPFRQFVQDPKHGPLPALLVLMTVMTGVVDAVEHPLARKGVRGQHDGQRGVRRPGSRRGPRLLPCCVPVVREVSSSGHSPAGWRSVTSAVTGSPSSATGAGVELLLLSAALAWAAAAGAPFNSAAKDGIAGLAAIALGVQNAVVRHLAVPDLTTTVLTMTITGIAADLRSRNHEVIVRRLTALGIDVLLGAVAGALLVLHDSPTVALWLAVGLMAVVTAGAAIVARRPGAWKVFAGIVERRLPGVFGRFGRRWGNVGYRAEPRRGPTILLGGQLRPMRLHREGSRERGRIAGENARISATTTPGRGDAGSEGFTLIELLIVMLILGVLAATVVYAVQGITGNSVEAACGYDLKTVETAVEAYKGEMGNYPMGMLSLSGATDSWGPTDNAAASLQAPLMNQSNAGPNKEANLISPAGPWLKDVPQNGTHYYIWVANDGSGEDHGRDRTGHGGGGQLHRLLRRQSHLSARPAGSLVRGHAASVAPACRCDDLSSDLPEIAPASARRTARKASIKRSSIAALRTVSPSRCSIDSGSVCGRRAGWAFAGRSAGSVVTSLR